MKIWNILKNLFKQDNTKSSEKLNSKLSIYSNNKICAMKGVLPFCKHISNVLIGSCYEEKIHYILDIFDEKKIVSLQMIHPQFVEGFDNSYKLGIYLSTQKDEETQERIDIIKSLKMELVYDDKETIKCFYKTYEISEKEQFINDAVKILIDYFNNNPEENFYFSFQDL